MSKTCLMLVAGERSGEIYGAELATALRARLGEVELFGCGGEAMRRAGVDTTVDAHTITMVGITEVLSGLPRVYRAFQTLLAEVDRRRPQLAVLIDFPDFNLRLAKKLRERNVRVVYYVSPQVWAWRRGRLRQLKARIDQMLCLFDFEEEIYQKAGIPVEHVGHPLVDMVRPHLSREDFFAKAGLDPQMTTVALLPMLVAKTTMMRNGTGLSRNRRVTCRVTALMKRMEVTSSTRAAETAARTMRAVRSSAARRSRYPRPFSMTTSKKRRSSMKPMTIIMATRKRITSRLANSMRWGMSRTPVARSAVVPLKAKAKRNFQKSKVPTMNPAKTLVARTCAPVQPSHLTARATNATRAA